MSIALFITTIILMLVSLILAVIEIWIVFTVAGFCLLGWVFILVEYSHGEEQYRFVPAFYQRTPDQQHGWGKFLTITSGAFIFTANILPECLFFFFFGEEKTLKVFACLNPI